MPSPFPGMDPWLEGPLWSTMHSQLAAEIARQLSPRLLPRYVALTNEWFVLADPEGVSISTPDLYPDVGIQETRRIRESDDATATAVASPVQLTTVMPARIPQVSVEIRDTERRRLVTAIELLSPSNKRGKGRRQYRERRRRIFSTSAHLLEIDLLRKGRRVPMREPLPVGDYFVLLCRAEQRPLTDVWPIRLSDPLPQVPVPLLRGDADVTLDLQAAFTAVYDVIGYRYLVDYSQPPRVALTAEQGAWAHECLTAAGAQGARS